MTLLVTCHDYTAWASLTDDLCDIDECQVVGGQSPYVHVQTDDAAMIGQLEGDDRVASVEVVG